MAKNWQEPRRFAGKGSTSLQAVIEGKKVRCPACNFQFRCFREGDYVCSKCQISFLAVDYSLELNERKNPYMFE